MNIGTGKLCDSEPCESFNNCYCNMVEEQIKTNLTHDCSVRKFNSHEVFSSSSPKTSSEPVLGQIISSLNNKLSCGYDDIPMPVI